MNNENATLADNTKTITVTVPIREKKEYRLDNGMVIERWEKISEKEYEVSTADVTQENADRMKNGSKVLWWGVAQLPRQNAFGAEELVPFHFSIPGETVEEVAGNYESQIEIALADLEEKIKKQQNQIVTASASDLSALEKVAKANGGGIIS